MSKETRARWSNYRSQPQDIAPAHPALPASGQTDSQPRVNVSGSATVRQTGHTFHLEPRSGFRVMVPASWKIVVDSLKEDILTYTFVPPPKQDSGDDKQPPLPLSNGVELVNHSPDDLRSKLVEKEVSSEGYAVVDECTTSYVCVQYPYCDCPQRGDT